MQAGCGGCAMIINGVPALACATFADEVKGKALSCQSVCPVGIETLTSILRMNRK